MKDSFDFKRMNIILYCSRWEATVAFYRDTLELPITFASDWFVEFQVGAAAFVSIADERRASIKSGGGVGVTLALQVADAAVAWHTLQTKAVSLQPMQERWGAQVFYFYDPEGHRLEIWSPKRGTGR
jgi:catechol 2,3-dioxygenase-like lactoylglutathione lyase family enzyme